MKKAQQCRKCGKWYKDPHGNYQVVHEDYDTTLCPDCNREIDNPKENK